MSRVAKAPIVLPKNVEFSLIDGLMTVKGPKGTLTQCYNKLVSITKENDNTVTFKPANDNSLGWAHAGTARALLKNMVDGVVKEFELTLELVGVGYRAQANGKTLTLSLGYSHPIEHKLADQISVETPNNTTVILRSIDKQLLGQEGAKIRAYRPPEPYKGKGVKYAGEQIARKEAKKK